MFTWTNFLDGICLLLKVTNEEKEHRVKSVQSYIYRYQNEVNDVVLVSLVVLTWKTSDIFLVFSLVTLNKYILNRLPHHTKTSWLICSANQSTGFCVMVLNMWTNYPDEFLWTLWTINLHCSIMKNCFINRTRWIHRRQRFGNLLKPLCYCKRVS